MERLTTNEIKSKLESFTYEEFLKIKSELLNDSRKSVRSLVEKYERNYQRKLKLIEEYNKKKRYENELLKQNIKYIAGVDEVGRGPLAGDVYAAAVILDPEVDILEINDSKKLSESQRERLAEEIKGKCLAYSIAYATVEEIDKYNILNATKLAMKRAIENLKITPEYILIDALNLEEANLNQISIVKGDELSISIGAASIIAKVERDNYMKKMSEKYPQYLFDKNKGYGTKEHLEAIKAYGLCEIHRKSFVKNFI